MQITKTIKTAFRTVMGRQGKISFVYKRVHVNPLILIEWSFWTHFSSPLQIVRYMMYLENIFLWQKLKFFTFP